ncbi:unnamed protein product [Ectocarpus fasciculatus]
MGFSSCNRFARLRLAESRQGTENAAGFQANETVLWFSCKMALVVVVPINLLIKYLIVVVGRPCSVASPPLTSRRSGRIGCGETNYSIYVYLGCTVRTKMHDIHLKS